jgi:hypothetical protein
VCVREVEWTETRGGRASERERERRDLRQAVRRRKTYTRYSRPRTSSPRADHSSDHTRTHTRAHARPQARTDHTTRIRTQARAHAGGDSKKTNTTATSAANKTRWHRMFAPACAVSRRFVGAATASFGAVTVPPRTAASVAGTDGERFVTAAGSVARGAGAGEEEDEEEAAAVAPAWSWGVETTCTSSRMKSCLKSWGGEGGAPSHAGGI